MAHAHSHAGHAPTRGHGHDHGPASYGRAFGVATALNLGYVLVQVAFGLAAHSVALLADAAHNLSDVLALLLAWGAAALVARRPSARFTYGLRKSSILAALANAAFLLLVTGGIAWEAVLRLVNPPQVQPLTVAWVAAGGILVNGGTALLFLSGRKSDLNIRAAFMHMFADALVSLGVVAAGVAIFFTGWEWLDPAASIAISVVIVAGTWGLARDAVRMSLDAVPEGIDLEAVRAHLAAGPGVASVHDLHVWALSTTETALTAHLVMPAGHPGDAFVAGICHDLQHRFGIGHATLQVETDPDHGCALAPEHVV